MKCPHCGEHISPTSQYVHVFEELWKSYPNKDGKKAALRHFKASVITDDDVSDIRQALDNYLSCDKVKKGFIKNGSTWFNNWRDWIDRTPERSLDYRDAVTELMEDNHGWD